MRQVYDAAYCSLHVRTTSSRGCLLISCSRAPGAPQQHRCVPLVHADAGLPVRTTLLLVIEALTCLANSTHKVEAKYYADGEE
jgi:hypothetical protein